MKTLTNEQAETLFAFLECFDLYTTGAWSSIEEGMRAEFGIKNPEEALEDARKALEG